MPTEQSNPVHERTLALLGWKAVFGQEDNSTGPTEIISALINIDCDFEDGTLNPELEVELRGILKASPILKRPEFLDQVRGVRESIPSPERYWWWWPERL